MIYISDTLDPEIGDKWHTSKECPPIKDHYLEVEETQLQSMGFDSVKDKCGLCQIRNSVETYNANFLGQPRRWPMYLWQTDMISKGYDVLDPKMSAALIWGQAMPCTPQGYQLGVFKTGAAGAALIEQLNSAPLPMVVGMLLVCPEFKPHGTWSIEKTPWRMVKTLNGAEILPMEEGYTPPPPEEKKRAR